MRKFFKQDKNYILYGAQIDMKDELLSYLVDYAKKDYQLRYNPLGLLDDTILTIQTCSKADIGVYSEFYDLLSAIYRYKCGSNQLEFLFDGMDHYTKYSNEWEAKFKLWLNQLLNNEPFLKTILQISVFKAEGHSLYLALNRLNTYMFQHFNLKIYKYKGIIEKAA